MNANPEIGQVLLTMFTYAQREHIAAYIRGHGDFNDATERFRLSSGTPLSPMLAILNVGPSFSPLEMMDLISGLSVVYAHALTTDLNRTQLAAILQSRGVPANYAMRLASEIDTEDSASVALGVRALARGVGSGSFLPAALVPYVAAAVAGLAGIVGEGENQRSHDTLVECWRLGEKLRRISKESQLNTLELVQEIVNGSPLTMQNPGGPSTLGGDAASFGGALMSGSPSAAAATAFDGFVNAITRFVEGTGEAGEPDHLSDSDALDEEAIDELQLPETLSDLAAAAYEANDPANMAVVTGQTDAPVRAYKKRRGFSKLKGFVKKVAPTVKTVMRSSADPTYHVKGAIKRLNQRGEPSDSVVAIAHELRDMAGGRA